MSKFRFTFTNDKETVEFEAGRTSLWDAMDESAKLPDSPSKSQKQDFMWAYFAAKQNGKLAELGVKDDAPIDEAIRHIADEYDMNIEQDKGDAPLASAPAK